MAQTRTLNGLPFNRMIDDFESRMFKGARDKQRFCSQPVEPLFCVVIVKYHRRSQWRSPWKLSSARTQQAYRVIGRCFVWIVLIQSISRDSIYFYCLQANCLLAHNELLLYAPKHKHKAIIRSPILFKQLRIKFTCKQTRADAIYKDLKFACSPRI